MPKSPYFLSPIAFALFFIACCLWLRWPLWESAFISDGSPLSWLSSVQLFAAAILACRLGIERAMPRLLAVWLMIAMFYLALDEEFMLHEQWKYGCPTWWIACKYEWVRELPMLMVGGLGLGTLLTMHIVTKRRLISVFLCTAYLIGLLALTVDLIPMPPALANIEEGLEVMASAVFLSAMLLI